MKKGIFIGSLSLITGCFLGAAGMNKIKENTNGDNKINKFKGYYNILNQWLKLKQEGNSIEKYFLENGYKTVAVYGMGELGNRLYSELKESGIDVKYAVDRNAANIFSDLKLLDKNEPFPYVDVMIITASFAYDEIYKELNKKVDFPIVSLEEVVYESF